MPQLLLITASALYFGSPDAVNAIDQNAESCAIP